MTLVDVANAAFRGHLEVLKWVRGNGAPWNEWVCANAARNGHLEILKWARINGAEWDIGDIRAAATFRQNSLEWLDANP